MTRRYNTHQKTTDANLATRRAKPLVGARYKVPDRICKVCAGAEPYRNHNCKTLRCACVPCAERAGR